MEIYNEDSVVALAAPLSLPCPTDSGVEKLMYGERSSLSCLAKVKADRGFLWSGQYVLVFE